MDTKVEGVETTFTTKLMDLNDDCLLAILEITPLEEICALKDTCHRLRQLAVRSMQIYYRNRNFFLCEKRKQLKVFYKFHGILEHLEISLGVLRSDRQATLLQILRRIIPTSDIKLKSLSIHHKVDSVSSRILLHTFRNVFDSLVALKIKYRFKVGRQEDDDDQLKEALELCTNLKELFVDVESLHGKFLRQIFKKLKFLELNYVSHPRLMPPLKEFLKLNPKIEYVSLMQCNKFITLNTLELPLYGSNLKGIGLTYHLCPPKRMLNQQQMQSALELCRLEKLKDLHYDTYGLDETRFFQRMAEKNKLIRLSLNVNIPANRRLAESVHPLTNLQELSFNFHMNDPSDDFFQIMCKRMQHLRAINLECQNIKRKHVIDIIVTCKNLGDLTIHGFLKYEQLTKKDGCDVVTRRNYRNSVRPLNVLIIVNGTEALFPRDYFEKERHIINVRQIQPSTYADSRKWGWCPFYDSIFRELSFD